MRLDGLCIAGEEGLHKTKRMIREAIDHELSDLGAGLIGDINIILNEILSNCSQHGRDEKVDLEIVTKGQCVALVVVADSHLRSKELAKAVEYAANAKKKGILMEVLDSLDSERGRGVLSLFRVSRPMLCGSALIIGLNCARLLED